MMSTIFYNITRRSLCTNARMLCVFQNATFNTTQYDNHRNYLYLQSRPNLTTIKRYKHSKKKSSKHKEEEDDEEDEEEYEEAEYDLNTKASKQIETKVISLRLDTVVKAGFGISRNKVEEAFYESSIRLNGKKTFKKSHQVSIGDEIDVIVGRSKDNPDFLIVNRIVFLSAQPVNAGFKIKLVREKSLLIEDYNEPAQ